MPRALSLYLPMWSIDLEWRRRARRGAAHDDGPSSAIVLTETVAGAQRITACCRTALGAGVRDGMTLAHARALLAGTDVHVEEADPARDRRALEALATWALRFSPVVAPDPPDGLLLDIHGLERLFHGERRLANALANAVTWRGFTARTAVAGTFAAARAVARFGPDDRTIVAAGNERAALAPLPIAALGLDDTVADALHEVAIETIGHLLELPRLELAARFGPDLLLRLDQATGEAIETIDPVRPVAPPAVERVFDGPVKDLEPVLVTVRTLVETLAQLLARRESGARRLDLEFERPGTTPAGATVRLSRPSRDPRHLWTLLRPRAERIDLGFGVERIVLRAAAVARLPHEQAERWRDGDDDDATALDKALGELLDAFTERFGPRRTARVEPAASHLPERAYRARTADDVRTRRRADPARIVSADRPSVLLARPEPAEVVALTPDGPPLHLRWRGRTRAVLAARGPERIAAEWWRGPARGSGAARDYFIVQIECGRWLWLYRSTSGRWYVHGEWA